MNFCSVSAGCSGRSTVLPCCQIWSRVVLQWLNKQAQSQPKLKLFKVNSCRHCHGMAETVTWPSGVSALVQNLWISRTNWQGQPKAKDLITRPRPRPRTSSSRPRPRTLNKSLRTGQGQGRGLTSLGYCARGHAWVVKPKPEPYYFSFSSYWVLVLRKNMCISVSKYIN